MTDLPQILPNAPRPIGVVLLPGGEIIGQLGALEAFEAANRIAVHIGRAAPYAVHVAGLAEQTVTVSGLTVLTPPVEALPPLHTLVMGGSLALVERPLAPTIRARLAPAIDGVARLVAICTGAFVLGRLGHLAGRRCTTHWLALDALRAQFPAAQVEDDVLFTRDGRLYTSAGATAGLDLALALIEADLGQRMARAVARSLVVSLRRPGGQSQFSAAAELAPTDDERLRRLVRAIVRAPAGDHRVDRLAERVGMSPRNFARVFRAELGVTPAQFVARVRLEAARAALESSDATQEAVADHCGYGSAETMRRAFLRALGVTPGDYRARSGAASGPS